MRQLAHRPTEPTRIVIDGRGGALLTPSKLFSSLGVAHTNVIAARSGFLAKEMFCRPFFFCFPMLRKPCCKRLQCWIFVHSTGWFLLPSQKQFDCRKYMGSTSVAHSATLWASPERPLASFFFQGATGRIARQGVRRVKSPDSFPSVFLCFQNAVVLAKMTSSVFLRFPSFSSVFLCSFYTACAAFSWPTLDGLVGQTICP